VYLLPCGLTSTYVAGIHRCAYHPTEPSASRALMALHEASEESAENRLLGNGHMRAKPIFSLTDRGIWSSIRSAKLFCKIV
jgi:hypothetical protein